VLQTRYGGLTILDRDALHHYAQIGRGDGPENLP